MENGNLKKLGFKGNLAWVHNEEGSGAKFYNSSVYYPDNPKNIQTNSGITIDPGLDLGNAERHLIQKVLNFYNNEGLLTLKALQRLNSAVGRKRENAANWLHDNRVYFKGSFLVPDDMALNVMDEYTAPDYWKPLVNYLPGILRVKDEPLAAALHTALLSQAYNRGAHTTVNFCKKFFDIGDFAGLSHAIKNIKYGPKSIRDRRAREAALIAEAVTLKDDFKITIDTKINTRPVTTIPILEKETLLMSFTEAPAKPEVNLST